MPKPPVRSITETKTTQLHVNVPGWLKNRVLDAAADSGQGVSEFVVAALVGWLEGSGFVERPVSSWVSPSDVIADYLAGRVTVAPCGRVWPCEGSGVGRDVVAGLEFCGVCGIRV